MNPIVDDKKYSTDTNPYGKAAVDYGFVNTFEESPVSSRMQLKDICVYKPDVENKNGKVGKTSWDSFSYALLMGHNVWTHIESVQRANREFDAGNYPRMMRNNTGTVLFKDVVESIFATSNRAEAEEIIESHSKYWMEIVGTRGFSGKKAMNARTQANKQFEIEGSVTVDKEVKEKYKPVLDLFEEG
jgi:hypothetical protein